MLLTLAMRLVWREKQSREFRIMGLALWLAVFAVTLLSCLTTSLQTSLNKDTANLLGGDLIAEASNPIGSEYQKIAKDKGLRVASMIEFFSMVIHNEQMQLTSIEAIENRFPLQGSITLETTQAPLKKVFAPPSAGEMWCDEELAKRLDLQLMDKVTLGNAQLIFTGIIRNRPVATSDSSVLAPTAFVNAADLPKLGVLQPGSRATYRILFSGTTQQLANFRTAVANKSSDIQWVTTTSGRPALNRTFTEVERYVSLILLLQVLLAAIAIAMCVHQYSIRQRKQVVTWRCIGASNITIIGTHMLALLLLAMGLIFTSVIAAYVIAKGVNIYLHPLGMQSSLSIKSGILGSTIGLIMLLGFGLPPLIELRKMSPIQILQREAMIRPWERILSYSIAFVLIVFLLTNFIGKEEKAISVVFAGKILGLGFIAFMIIYVIWQVFLPLSKKGGLTWRLGMSYLARNQWQTITQLLVFTIVLTLLLLVQILQYDFIERWRSQLASSTPNYFLINILPEQVETLNAWFSARAIVDAKFYPIVRGRMNEVNGLRIDQTNNPSSPKGLNRPINLTWMKQLPDDNQLISGIAWDKVEEGQPLISVEKGFADRQHLQLGDKIGFEIADQEIYGKIVSFRTVNWESFKPNFFVIFPPHVIDNFPHTYFTSVYIPANQKFHMLDLAKSFNEISIIDIDAVLTKVREMVIKLAYVLNGLLMIVFILGILIMYANLISTLKERLQESAMLRMLGAQKKLIGKMLVIEFLILGVLSGLMAGVMATVLAQELAQSFFSLPFVFHLKWLIIGCLMGIIMITVCGLFGAREISKVSPLWLFKQS